MSIVEFDGPPSCSLDASETGESFVLSPVLLASRGQDGGPWNSAIDICDLMEK